MGNVQNKSCLWQYTVIKTYTKYEYSEGKEVSVCIVKAYKGSEGRLPCILHLGIRCGEWSTSRSQPPGGGGGGRAPSSFEQRVGSLGLNDLSLKNEEDCFFC